MQGIEKIQAVNSYVAGNIRARGGFILNIEVPELIKIDPFLSVLVRCGNGRFTCPVQELNHFINIITEHAELKAKAANVEFAGDHVRDVSLPA